MSRPITSDAVVAYTQCLRKAYFLIQGKSNESQHEYEQVLAERAAANRSLYVVQLSSNELESTPERTSNDRGIAGVVRAADLVASCDALVKRSTGNDMTHSRYEPHLAVGTRRVSSEQKLTLAFAGFTVGETRRYVPDSGVVVPFGGGPKRIKLSPLYSRIRSIVTSLRTIANDPAVETPPLILNRNCATCPFHDHCLLEAEETDNLTLLQRMNSKLLRRYARKGVFTVNQLSYLFRPRRPRKRSLVVQPSFNIELQALAIRTNKIYLHEPPSIKDHPVEFYLDIEGIPDQEFQYLIGLHTNSCDSVIKQSFWADTADDERRIFQECFEAMNRYPEAPIFHYGSYELQAISKAATKFGLDCAAISERLVNLNSFIFEKVYFPTRSNTLKDLGVTVGASWSTKAPSGLQSIAWRYCWEDTGADKYKEMLLRYNHEDCHAVRLLKEQLKSLGETANSRPEVAFPSTSKTSTTPIGQVIHDTFNGILKSAHLTYKQKRIKIHSADAAKPEQKESIRHVRGPRKKKLIPSRAGKAIHVPRKRKCPRCDNQELRRSRKIVEHRMFDLVLTQSGCRKTVVKYVGHFARCPQCGYYYSPPGIKRLRGQLYARGFACVTTYLRVVLRLPIRVISGVFEAMFSEHVAPAVVGDFVSRTATEYESCEESLLQRVLQSPFIHCDETKLNIGGVDHFAWVLTDGLRFVFRLTKTREIAPIRQLLDCYEGVLVSDFYSGYDSVTCRQQKCLVHLIRDLNDDLWRNPFHEDYENFVGSVRDFLVPIFEDVTKHGVKTRYLRKHLKVVDRFYTRIVEGSDCRSELVETYKKRFKRYRESLFLFLVEDGLPWNNNMAERGLRHLSVQQKISGCFVGNGAGDYLRLLGISQTCRFQHKSFLQFLLSGERNVDDFKAKNRRRNTD